MSSILHVNLNCIESILDVPTTLSKPSKRWHLAFATIYCARVLHSLLNEKKNSSKLPVATPSFVVLNVKPDAFSSIDQTTLTEIVKEKNLKLLLESGGVEGVADALETDIKNGISGAVDDVALRQEAFGSNTYKRPPPKSLFHFVVEAFKDLTILILLFCAALSLGFGIKEHGLKEGWYDGGSIFVAVILVISVSAVSNFRQNRQFEKLSKVSNNIKIDVFRNGRRQQISIFEIVVGDVVSLKIGDQVPADGLFLDGHSLQVDESSMTGESDHVEVNSSHNPFLFSGTKVADGYAQMLVTSVGMNTTWGQMMSTISRDTNEQTPLQARLNKLTSSIGKAGLAVAFLVLVVLLVRYFTGNTEDENGNQEFNGSKTKADDIVNAVVEIIATAVTIVVVAIPEGLPLAVTLTLAYSMKRMMADQAMVRKLSACETMGSATTICTDKTGTLTMNQMKVTKIWLGQEPIEVSSSISENLLNLIQQGVALNTTGSVYRATSGSYKFEFFGSPTEKAILSWAVLELDMDMEILKQNCTILHVEAFNSEKKRSGVSIRSKADNTIHVHWKGAAEMILAMCSSYYDASGSMKDLDDCERKTFEQIIQGMAASSLRCIAFAHKQILEEEHEIREATQKLKEDGLAFVGLVGIKDPCRPGVRKAVEDCQHAGVNVKMITGDNVFTARAIATECGILRPDQGINNEAVVEGEVFRNYTPEERMEKVDKIRVMARCSPFDKLLMVQCFETEWSCGCSHRALKWPKRAQISSSWMIILLQGSTVLRWEAAVSAGEVPLTAVQLLWVNLIMDTLGALALATEQPTNELMDRPPVGESIFGVSEKVKDTLIFNTFVLCQVFNEFNARRLEKKNVFEGIHKNKLFLGIIGITIILQVLCGIFEEICRYGEVELGQWGACLGIAAVSWPLGWVVKCIPVSNKPFSAI
ncbi:putative calcium-transporting ATPase 13, plasma membrane-type [Vitis vinifera]|uniref:Calcium-transporting ATPase n=1 Tax=Vitis vinifera TaxID=29760 RepID=A0A438KL13_VITVI|nr:putative calcium-transporting ATPase 13, plasma membrane-type [Vitis vinifera]